MTIDEKKILGARMKSRRIDLQITRDNLAADIGSSPDTIRQWEYGHARPKPHFAVKIAKALNCEFDSLFPDLGGANQLTRVCASRGITLKGLSERLNMQRQYITRIAGGKVGASFEVAYKISKELDCGINDLGIRVSRRTHNYTWQQDVLCLIDIQKRNKAFSEYSNLIGGVIKRQIPVLKATGVDLDDVRQELCVELLRALDSLIIRNSLGNYAAHYLQNCLSNALTRYCVKEDKHGVKYAPKDGTFRVVSIESLLDKGIQLNCTSSWN